MNTVPFKQYQYDLGKGKIREYYIVKSDDLSLKERSLYLLNRSMCWINTKFLPGASPLMAAFLLSRG